MRFRPCQRLRKASDFARLRAQALSVDCGAFALRAARRDPPDGPARLGLIASRRTGNAVARNRIRRRFREIFRLHPEAFVSGVDYLVHARAHCTRCAYAELEQRVLAGLLRLNPRLLRTPQKQA